MILRHNKVSGKHALVTFRNGSFYIQDTSTNGTAVNNPANRLVRKRPYALEDGDRVLIEPYEIEVAVDEEDRAPERGDVVWPREQRCAGPRGASGHHRR